MNKKNDFFVNCYEVNLAMCTVYKWQLWDYNKINANLEIFYFNDYF